MVSGTGLGSALMFANESAWGTAATVDHSPRFLNETINLNKTFLQDEGLRGGGYMPLAAGNVEVERGVAGGWLMNLPTRGIGMLLRHMLGGTAATPTILVTPAYKAIHQIGFTDALGLTVQVQRPQRNGTVKPFTYFGCKITGWEISITAGALVTLSITLDGLDATTATAAATYTPVVGTKAWAFGNATVLKLGGTASTTSGLVSVASGTQMVSIVKDLKFTCTRADSTSDYGVGFGGLKAEQVNNGWGDVKVSMTTEFGLQSELYDVFVAGTVQPIQCTLTGSAIGASGSNDTFDIIGSAMKITDTTGPNVAGPDIVQMSVNGVLLDDQVNSPLQVVTISADTTL